MQTFVGARHLTSATGFFFRQDARLFLVTSGHVLEDAPSGHHPDRVELDLRVGEEHLSASARFVIPLVDRGRALWLGCADRAGPVDVSAIEIAPGLLPANALYRAFGPENLLPRLDMVEVGQSLLIVGYPLGFHDHLHQLPIVRQAAIASSFGLRFQGQGYFLTDARTHRGSSGAPVVMNGTGERRPENGLPWLLGVHSARLDMGLRDGGIDEALGLNCAWYADVLMVLAEARQA